jgi:hypothetical protein
MLRKTLLTLILPCVLPAEANAQLGSFDGSAYTTMGHFAVTDTGVDRGFRISGVAMLVRSGNATQVYSQVCGLDPSTTYGSHVHDLPTALGGGGHYKIDPNEAGTVESNELWPTLTSDASGVAYGFDEVLDHRARPEAQSIVIHDPADGARIAICDLRGPSSGDADVAGTVATPSVVGGTFKTTDAGMAKGYNIGGNVTLSRCGGVTWVRSVATGLNPDTTYGSHVHDLPSVLGGGGHYKIDPNEAGTIESNEIWPTLTADGLGVGTGEAWVPHVARPEAQSVVIHDPSDGARIAICDLSARQNQYVTTGTCTSTATGIVRGFRIIGNATMARDARIGSTTVNISVRGLTPDTTFASHVHFLPSHLGGGGHYKIDPSIGGTVESNEIWCPLTTNANGRATFEIEVADHLARPEAQSIVIHDPADGARIGILTFE